MTLLVYPTGIYRSEISSDWRPKDYDIRNLVKALKGEEFKGYSEISIHGKAYRFTAKDTDPAYALWAAWASTVLRHLKLGKVILVPVPSSSQVRFGQMTPPVRMATKLSAVAPDVAIVGNYLRHETKQPKSHTEGGSRDPSTIEAALVCHVTDASLPIVLIDDVVTSGGHLIAAARTLRQNGAKVEHALVAGRAKREAVTDPFKPEPEDLEADPFEGFTE